VRGLERGAAQRGPAFADPTLDLIARPVEDARQEPVQALSGRRGRHLDGQFAGRFGSRRGHRLSSAISVSPTEIALSATLNDGQ